MIERGRKTFAMRTWRIKGIAIAFFLTVILICAFFYTKATQGLADEEGPLVVHKELGHYHQKLAEILSMERDAGLEIYGDHEGDGDPERSENQKEKDQLGKPEETVAKSAMKDLSNREEEKHDGTIGEKGGDESGSNESSAKEQQGRQNQTSTNVNSNSRLIAKMLARAKANKESLELYLKPFNPAEVVENRSIFLFETNNDIQEFAARTICALESAAWSNPSRNIFLLIR